MQLIQHYFLHHGGALTEIPFAPTGLYDYVVTQDLVLIRAQRAGLSLCLPWAKLGASLRGLTAILDATELYPGVELIGGKVTTTELLKLQLAARTPIGETFKETLFFLSVAGQCNYMSELSCRRRWWKPKQRQSYSMAQAVDLDDSYASVVLELHTHPKWASEFSATDDADEHGLRLYALLEDPDSDTPLIRLRASVYGQLVEIPAGWVFDLPEGWRDPVGKAFADGVGEGADLGLRVGMCDAQGGAA